MKQQIALLFAVLSLAMNAATLQGKVVRVADGDTITVLDSDKVQNKIRLVKIDAPEKKQAFGNVSRDRLSQLVAGKEVTVEWKQKDKYGRILGEVFVEKLNVNLQMVKDGLAWHYKHFDKSTEFAKAEQAAREKKVGLWKDPNPVAPWDFRKQNKRR